QWLIRSVIRPKEPLWPHCRRRILLVPRHRSISFSRQVSPLHWRRDPAVFCFPSFPKHLWVEYSYPKDVQKSELVKNFTNSPCEQNYRVIVSSPRLKTDHLNMKLNRRGIAVAALIASLQMISAGDITGKITLKGTPPPEKELPLDPNCGKLHPEGTPKTR